MKKALKFEPRNFRVSSAGWKKITVAGKKYLVNPEGDIWEITDGEAKGEQLFTLDAAMRETAKAGKRMPTDKEFSRLLKTKADMPNLVLAGYRYSTGSFGYRGAVAYLWSSTEYGSYAWYRYLSSGYATVYRSYINKACGFSVRCLKK